jgi:hypothetical protein
MATDPNWPPPDPSQRWVAAVTVERPTGWRWLAAAVCDERVMYPAAVGWLAGIVAAAIWDESWERILLTGAVVALSGAVWGCLAVLACHTGPQGHLSRPSGRTAVMNEHVCARGGRSAATPLLRRQMDATPEPEVWCRHCGAEVIVDNSVGAWVHAWSGLVACHLLDGPTGVG